MKRTFFVTVHTTTGFNVEVEDNSDSETWSEQKWNEIRQQALTLAKEKHPGLRWTSDGEDIEEVV